MSQFRDPAEGGIPAELGVSAAGETDETPGPNLLAGAGVPAGSDSRAGEHSRGKLPLRDTIAVIGAVGVGNPAGNCLRQCCATDAIGAIGDASVEFAPAGVAESSGAGRFASGKFVGRPKRRLAGIGGFGECVAFPRGSVRIVARGAGGVGGVSLCGGRGARAIYAGIQPIDKDDTAMRSPVDETPDLSCALPE